MALLKARSQKVGCPDKLCSPWEYREGCCKACVSPDDWEDFDLWWEAITEWLFYATGSRFPGKCDVETRPCPPCGCPSYCGCGPYASIDLGEAFCQPICVVDGKPCLEFVFPNGDGTETVIGPNDGHWSLLPDLVTVDWCKPFTNNCGGMWPEQKQCDDPWSIRATVGCPPPKILELGASRFVCEIIKECKGQDSCLPDGVRSIVRRGITADVGQNFEEVVNFDTQGTGVAILDFALREFGKKTVSTARFVDPMRRLGQLDRRCWSYRGVLDAKPVTSVAGCK